MIVFSARYEDAFSQLGDVIEDFCIDDTEFREGRDFYLLAMNEAYDKKPDGYLLMSLKIRSWTCL